MSSKPEENQYKLITKSISVLKSPAFLVVLRGVPSLTCPFQQTLVLSSDVLPIETIRNACFIFCKAMQNLSISEGFLVGVPSQFENQDLSTQMSGSY